MVVVKVWITVDHHTQSKLFPPPPNVINTFPSPHHPTKCNQHFCPPTPNVIKPVSTTAKRNHFATTTTERNQNLLYSHHQTYFLPPLKHNSLFSK
jgi:hypothetical protein